MTAFELKVFRTERNNNGGHREQEDNEDKWKRVCFIGRGERLQALLR
jgi:hypothetical protein